MAEETTTALALNDDLMRELAGMAGVEDSTAVQSLPVLKINYDADSIHPVGSWVVGQKKKDDAITEEGEKVKGLVVLAKRLRYAYYVESDTKKNCNSPLHMQGDKVKGSNYHQVCGKTCSYRAEGLDPRCQAQIVVFGLALTEDDKLVECLAYIKGSNYMPFSEYIEAMTKVKSGSKMITVPTFTFLTLLGSEPKKNGSVKYWVGTYTKGPNFSIEQLRSFDEKRSQVQAYIERLNAAIGASTEPSAPTVTAEAADDIPDFSRGKVSAAAADEAPPWTEKKESEIIDITPAAPADDIEAAIAKAMAGMKG